MEIHAAEMIVPVSRPFEVEIAIGKLKRYKFPGICHILVELVQAGGETLHSEIRELVNSIWNKEELFEQ
jgi:hypothetical protein